MLKACALAALLSIPLAAPAASLTIPPTYPRVWYGNAARLQQARTYFQTTPFTPSGGDATELNASRALHGLITMNNAECDSAVTHLVNWRAENEGSFRDALRQQGDGLLSIYDWCHHRMTAPQISAFVARWNGYLDIEFNDDFANQGAEGNNYFWGRVRNFLWFGITSFGENARAQEFIDHALDVRLNTWFSEWYDDFGRGGVVAEGADYGIVMLSYPILPFQSAADFGFDPYNWTPFFREAIYSVIYGTTPGPTSNSGTGGFTGGHLVFPFNDDENFRNGGVINTRDYLGDFARFMGSRNPTSGNARHARAYLTLTNAGRRWMFDALGGTGQVSDINALPLDYYAPGAAVFDTRTGHDANSMAIHIQLGTPGGIEHRHRDAGTFQIWRKGRWLTRESVGYAEQVTGFGGTGSVDTEDHLAHNGLQFQGRTTGRWVGTGPIVIPPGVDRGDNPRGLPRVVRLEHAPDYGYIAVDFGDAYRNTTGTRVDWPYAEEAVRELLFIRPLHALVVMDRMRASSDSMLPYYFGQDWVERNDPLAVHVNAPQVVRTFLMHFETTPVPAGNRVAATVGNQVSELITLMPTVPVFRVVNEDTAGNPAAGQFRLELDSSGATETYFINVVHGRDVGVAPLAATLTDNGTSWSLQLTHPVQGSASVVFNKGMTSAGGTIAIGGGQAQPLRQTVQGIVVTADGPVWEANDVQYRNGFENP
jgi:hypothetical protein